MGARISSCNHTIVVQKNKRETCHYFQTEITLENLIWAARRQEFISYKRLNQAQGIADEDWSFASSLLMRHLDHLANRTYRDGKPVFSFLAVARKELATGSHTLGVIGKLSAHWVTARLPKRTFRPLSKKSRCDVLHGDWRRAGRHREKNLRCAAPTSPQCRSSGSPSGTHQKTLMSGYLKPFQPSPTRPARPKL